MRAGPARLMPGDRIMTSHGPATVVSRESFVLPAARPGEPQAPRVRWTVRYRPDTAPPQSSTGCITWNALKGTDLVEVIER